MKIGIIILLLLNLTSFTWAAGIKGACDVRFFVTTIVEDFFGTARCQPFMVDIELNADGERIFRNVEVDVPISEMDTQKKARDKKLREMFQSETFPYIHVSARNVEPYRIRQEMKGGEKGGGALDLVIKIRDIEHKITARLSGLQESAERISLEMEFPVSLKDYRLKPPSPFFGLIRVDDKVIVKVTVGLEARPVEVFSR